MSQVNHVDPNAMPRRSWNTQADISALWDYTYQLVGDLRHRLEDAERRLRELEGKKKK